MSTESSLKLSPRAEDRTANETELSLRDTTVAYAEIPGRESVTAKVRVETNAGKYFAEAEKERLLVEQAAAARDAGAQHAAEAKPASHLKAAVGGFGTRISSKFEGMKDGVSQKIHERAANSEEERARKEVASVRQRAIDDAKKEAEDMAAASSHGAIVTELATGKDIVAVAQVPLREEVVGTGIAKSHYETHINKAAKERELAAAAEECKTRAEATLESVHPVCEAKSSISGLGQLISSRFQEVKGWLGVKLHERHQQQAVAKGETELAKDIARAREKAKAAAEEEAARQDRQATVHVLGELGKESAQAQA